ncbi:MAG: LamG domain-containing protein, partial [Cyclobacteriaceae bacterium]
MKPLTSKKILGLFLFLAVNLFSSAQDLNSALTELNSRYTEITSLIPSRYDFVYDGTNNINDGGLDMYDGGNILNTNIGTNIPYTGGSITSSTVFGTAGQYFTQEYVGLFVMGATLDNISTFSITGNNGADGTGSFQGYTIYRTVNGVNYRGFIKEVWNATDPSINHLVIVKDDISSASHSWGTTTDDDLHTISNLANDTEIFYLLYSKQSGLQVTQTEHEAIMDKAVEILFDQSNSALSFNGSSDYVSGTGINLANSDFTVEGWFNTNSPTTFQTLFSLGSAGSNNEALHINLENTQVKVGFYFSDVTIPWTVTSGWHHISVSHNTSSLESTVYIDGLPIGSGTHPSVAFTVNTSYTIGRNSWDPSGYFNGQLDDIRIWNSERSAADIASNYDNTLDPALYSDLVSYFDFGSGSGTTAIDSKSAFNGSFNGTPTWVTTGPSLDASPTPPTTQVSNLEVTGGISQAYARWTRGNGDEVVVFAAEASTGSPLVIDGTSYTASTTFGSGSNLGDGWFCVYRGTNLNATIQALTPDTDYRFVAYEVNSSDEYLKTQTSNVVNESTQASIVGTQSALAFDGATNALYDYVTLPSLNAVGSAQPFTIEAWVKLDASTPTGWRTLLEFGNDAPYFGLQNGTDFNIAGTTPAYTIPVDQWTHLAAACDGSTLRIIVDGIERGDQIITPGNSGVGAGIGFNSGDNPFRGLIDEVRYWNIYRDPATINSEKDTELTGSESGLVAYYNFNDGTGNTLADLSTNSHNGTLMNGGGAADGNLLGPIWTGDTPALSPPAPIGNSALTFDGTDDYVVTTTSASISDISDSGFSMEAWVYPTVATINSIIRKGGDYDLYLNGASSVLYAEVWDDGTSDWRIVTGPSCIALNTWSHVAFSWDGSVGDFYVNGVHTAGSTGGVSTNTLVSELGIGGSSVIGQTFNGRIDEVRIWGKTLSKAHIDYYRDNELTGDEEGLLAYYDFEDGTGTTLTNVEGTTALDATLQNMDNADWVEGNSAVGDPIGTEPDFVLDFDGADDYVELGTALRTSLAGTTNLTVEAWVYPKAAKSF